MSEKTPQAMLMDEVSLAARQIVNKDKAITAQRATLQQLQAERSAIFNAAVKKQQAVSVLNGRAGTTEIKAQAEFEEQVDRAKRNV